MARAVLAAGAVVTGAGAAIALLIAAAGVDQLLQALPPLAIGPDAVRATLIALAGGLALAMAAHVAVLVGLRSASPRGGRRAVSAGILLAALLAAMLVALGTAAATSAVTEADARALLVGGAATAFLASLAYGLATARLVGELRSIGPP